MNHKSSSSTYNAGRVTLNQYSKLHRNNDSNSIGSSSHMGGHIGNYTSSGLNNQHFLNQDSIESGHSPKQASIFHQQRSSIEKKDTESP